MSGEETKQMFNTLMTLVMSPSAQKIDFTLGSVHVDGSGFASVYYALVKYATSQHGGIGAEVGGVPPGAAAGYDNANNVFKFPHARFGASDENERMSLIHECVHAMQDIAAGMPRSPPGSRPTTQSENEAAAYIAAMLFLIYENPGVRLSYPPSADKHWIKALEIAYKIENAKGAHVSDVDAIILRIWISLHPVYRSVGIGFFAPLTWADGVG
jgi:hypothetical protein